MKTRSMSKEIVCGRCHNVIRHGRVRGLVVAFCNCLSRDTRTVLMGIFRNVDVAMEVESVN